MIIARYKSDAELRLFFEKEKISQRSIVWKFTTALAVLVADHDDAQATDGVTILRDAPATQVPILRKRKSGGKVKATRAPGRESDAASLFAGGGASPAVGVGILDLGIKQTGGVFVAANRFWDFTVGPAQNVSIADNFHGRNMGYRVKKASPATPVSLWSLRVKTACQMSAAIDWVIAHNASSKPGERISVLCSALIFCGAPVSSIDFLKSRIQSAENSGIPVFVALGNTPPLCPPATADAAITVGAYDLLRVYDPNDDAVHVMEATPGPEDYCKPNVLAKWGDYSLGTGSPGAGTSMATAHVTGIVASWRYNDPSLTPAGIRDRINHLTRHLDSAYMPACKLPDLPNGYPVVEGPS